MSLLPTSTLGVESGPVMRHPLPPASAGARVGRRRSARARRSGLNQPGSGGGASGVGGIDPGRSAGSAASRLIASGAWTNQPGSGWPGNEPGSGHARLAVNQPGSDTSINQPGSGITGSGITHNERRHKCRRKGRADRNVGASTGSRTGSRRRFQPPQNGRNFPRIAAFPRFLTL